MKYLIKGARVFDPGEGLDGLLDVRVEGERIVEVGPSLKPKGEEVIGLRGLTLFPGFIDLHAHLREPGGTHKEDIETGSRAALAGGFTTVVAMPNTEPPVDNPGWVRYVVRRAEEVGLVRVLPAGAITKARQGAELAEMGLMAQAGAVMFTDDGDWISDSGVMRRAMDYARGLGLLLGTHALDPSLAGDAHECPLVHRLGLRPSPPEAEEVAVYRDISLAARTGARLHIHHITTRGSLSLVEAAKRTGIKVTCEATPHHLLFTVEKLADFDPTYKVMPPLREERDRRALVEGVAAGVIDAIATDHAPHSPYEKELPWEEAPPGMAGLETAFSALYTHLVREGELALEALVRALTSGPARVLGREDIGRVAPGARADLVAWDLGSRWRVEELASKSENNPFLGESLFGALRFVMVDGEIKRMD